ncbi:hypothetical protein BX666DRAFT_854012 [Dichotomocladium elegans]|nr:hypothetical protein BX666DRAFT_854012 [Dichotomocladium elegans]
MEESQDTLKVAHSVVSKELARFRPCDIETRCYFCREWAQFVQKKHFSWSTRNQTDTKPTKQQQQQQQQQQQRDNAHVFTAGRYKIKLGSSVNDKIKYKSNARELFVDFKSMLKNSVDEINSLKTEKLIQVSEQWIAEPTQLVTLPSLFEPVEFNPYDAAAKIQDDPGAPAKILEPLVIDRQNILFPISRFQLLRNLTPDVLQNFSEPTCDHTRPEFKTPSELDIERDIYNENLQRELKTATAELERALDEAYSRLSNFITQAKALEKERCSLMGPECQKSIDYFAAKQNIKPFPEYWASLGDLKKQKVPAETIDGYFNGYFDQLIDHVKVFQTDFAEPQLNAACELMEKTWNIVASSVRQVFERKDTVKPGDKEYAERCGAYLTYIGKYNPVELVRVNIENARKDLDFRIKEYLPEITEVMRMYRVESKQTTVGRVEKVAKASFKKLIKKATSGYDSIRHHFRYLMTQKVLSEIRFCACLVIGMEVLMLEAEEVEVNVIHREINRFLDTHKEMAAAQAHLYKMFEEGISTGRTELAGVIGRLVLKETMRVQGDSIAKQRQSNLLESLGLPVEGEGEMSKKKRARKKKAEPEPEPVPVPESEPEHELRNGSLKKRLTKKATTPVIEAAKTATPSTKEVLAAAESETIDSLSEARADAPGAQQSFEEHSKQETIDTPLSAKVDTTSSAERDPVEHIHVASKGKLEQKTSHLDDVAEPQSSSTRYHRSFFEGTQNQFYFAGYRASSSCFRFGQMGNSWKIE